MKGKTQKGPFFVLTKSGGGRLIPPSWHEQAMAIFQVVDGEVCASVGTVSFEARRGDCFFVPTALVYSVEALSPRATLRALVFESSILEANMASLDSELLYMFEVQSRIRVPLFTEEHPIHAELTRYLTDALDEFAAKDVCYKLPIRADIYRIVTLLLRHYGVARDDADRMVYHNVLRLRPALEYIRRQYRQKLTLAQLSAMIHVSSDHFTRMFKESIGRTPVDYINGVRVAEAQRLLAGTELSLGAIAEQIGFCNANYFHKIFKQYMNESPLSYRKGAGLVSSDA